MKRENIEAVFSYLGDAILIVNQHSEILYCNDSFCSLFGYALAEIQNKEMGLLLDQSYAENHLSHVGGYLNSELPPMEMMGRRIFECTTKDGTTFPAKISISRLQSENEPLGIAIVHNISDIEQQRKKQEALVRTDTLTTAFNIRYLRELIAPDSPAFDDCNTIGVLFIDLDDFKPVNDSYGHNIGDEVLKLTTSRIMGAVRENDFVFRVGGDEFVVLCPGVKNNNNLTDIVTKVHAIISTPIHLDDVVLSVHASIGVCLFPDEVCTLSDAIELADEHMYRSKKQGQ